MRLDPDYPITTERLRLRPLTDADVEALVAYRSIPEVCAYVPFEPMDHAAVSARVHGPWARRSIEAEGEGLILGVELAEAGTVIGDVMLHFSSAEHRGGEVGWVQHPLYGGRGYMTEAVQALFAAGFGALGLHRIVARVDARNLPSQRLCERLGMRREAHLVQNEWFKGRWTDEILFAKLDSEWRTSRAQARRRG